MIINWRKSSRSEPDGSCVELGDDGVRYGVRDSKNEDGPVLLFTLAARRAFLASLRADGSAGPQA